MNIGILTSGGDCPGLNAVIRAAVMTMKNAGSQHNVYGFIDGFGGLYEENGFRQLTIKDVDDIERVGGTILGTTNRGDFGEVGQLKEPSEQALNTIEKIKKRKQELQLDALIVTGGDGSLRIAYWVGQQTGMNIIGIPKTIDNDLANTDVTLGFNTAVSTATDAISKIRDTARSHHRVMVVEVMGRNAGWIALSSGIAGGADVILLPEIPYNFDNLIKYLVKKSEEERKAMVIVFAEGAYEVGSKPEFPINGAKLTRKIEEHGNINLEARLSVLGYIQRGGEPSSFDKILGTRLGQTAATLILEGKSNVYLSVQHDNLEPKPLSMASSDTRFVPPTHELVRTAKAIGVYFGDE